MFVSDYSLGNLKHVQVASCIMQVVHMQEGICCFIYASDGVCNMARCLYASIWCGFADIVQWCMEELYSPHHLVQRCRDFLHHCLVVTLFAIATSSSAPRLQRADFLHHAIAGGGRGHCGAYFVQNSVYALVDTSWPVSTYMHLRVLIVFAC